MASKVKFEFDSGAQSYDKQRAKLIPCFNDVYGMAIDNLNFDIPNPNIVDMGAGTGLFSSFVLQKFPKATITLVDISEKMLEKAKERFELNSSLEFVIKDFINFVPLNLCDAIISSFAIHHLEDEDKIKLYQSIPSMLKEEGVFVHVERIAADTKYFDQLYEMKWRSNVESSNFSEEEKQVLYKRVQLDKRTSLSTQVTWLKEAGFSEVDCLYKYYDFAVIYCKK